MKTVYVAGNLLLARDNMPLRIMPALQKRFPHIKFAEFDPSEEFPEEKEIYILDTVADIKKVIVTGDVDAIAVGKKYSLHDFDLGTTLKLMKKAGRLDKATIIGVPQGMTEDDAIKEVSEALKEILKKK